MKRAVLVFFYFGEKSYVNRLAQETVALRHALKGYEKSVLLHHETNLGPLKVSDADAKHASVVDLPTKENFVKYLNQLGEEGYEVDLFVFSHGNTRSFLVSKGTYGDSDVIRAAYIQNQVKHPCLRAVWQVNCYGSTLNPTWLKLGAKVTAGSRFVNFYPTRFAGFIRAWSGGATFAEALDASDTVWVRTPVQAYLIADAAARVGEWKGSVALSTRVLGNNTHAASYFQECWLGADWDPTKSGKQNMNHASEMLLEGDGSLLKDSHDTV